ncbi:DHH family phosphoesterase [Acetobacterium wieringae]|jgi:c-di-AMP phosphodiesterase-like protein|uniref:Cyclic-di-AMP phosphodiesterase n=1 Tax=Acetobacterium wieringae TaxID=52694 RepID=A0ABY6HEQ0_9FIRM|nr:MULTISPECIES: DHH family phosphoesterase [Acetobacterium]HAZ05862.1 phosphoesterase [Acetobacterium sp.]MEA4805443.1 DHH family phosphoesterase [Acetobacterium wieringae]OXS26320.1 MAG: phosphoesterase [Acetobacterium sp. MES1]URN84423.1 DHH family phosphoesterase [Acetobacterium wieringae]UYO62852.1 DHH family phosphoesterase [Acetobacterium wieringae]
MKESKKDIVRFALAAQLIVSLVLGFYNIFLGIGGVVIFVILIMYYTKNTTIDEIKIDKAIDEIYSDLDKINQERMYEMPIAMAIVDNEGIIYWYNQAFGKAFKKEKEGLFKKNIITELDFNLTAAIKADEFTFHYEERDYGVVTNAFSDKIHSFELLHFFDITEQSKQRQLYRKNSPLFCYIVIDNYDDIIEQIPSHKRSAILGKVDLKLNEWAKQLGSVIIEYESDRYLMIFERGKICALQKENFKILDEIREIENDEKVPITLSIGIGISESILGIIESQELSHSALDIALARGGDQAVVRQDEKMSFYGGKSEATEKRTKVKARVKAYGLKELIKESDHVLMMGHQNPDMDCLGSAVGLLGACKSLGKEGKIVIREINYSIKSLFDYLLENEAYQDAFITPKEAESYATKNTLLIILDTQTVNYLEMPSLVDQIPKIVVIDHHRRSGKAIKETLLTYTEAYASSTCELVTELLQYFDEKSQLNVIEANALMAGMCMDTKMFTLKTGVRTFEAASYLRRKGADTLISKILLQDDLNTYTAKSDAVKNAKIYFDNIAISTFENNTDYGKVIAAQAADELLNIKGIVASFIILKNEEGLAISARSMGEVNVQVILEKLGGGGHLAIAGAQFPGEKNIETGVELLLTAIKKYKKENGS